eukprot:scaffold8210_cov102-Cylindrotheca_fusiformis.AAC.1
MDETDQHKPLLLAESQGEVVVDEGSSEEGDTQLGAIKKVWFGLIALVLILGVATLPSPTTVKRAKDGKIYKELDPVHIVVNKVA